MQIKNLKTKGQTDQPTDTRTPITPPPWYVLGSTIKAGINMAYLKFLQCYRPIQRFLQIEQHRMCSLILNI